MASIHRVCIWLNLTKKAKLSRDTVPIKFKKLQNFHFNNQQVIGDKAGGLTALAMKKAGAVDAVHLLEKTSGAKVKFIHVVRNPFDNIATMVLRHRKVNERYGEHNQKARENEIEDITSWREEKIFMFQWLKQYFLTGRSERVK